MNRNYRRIAKEHREIMQQLKEFSEDSVINLKELPQGDLPGERAEAKEAQVKNAKLLFAELFKELPIYFGKNPYQRVVIAVCGGSGVGKTGMAALLAYYFGQSGLGCYILSGDNYPHRIPKYNDAERLRIFRENGIRRMVEDGVYSPKRFSLVREWQAMEEDANPIYLKEHPWFASYLKGGREGLEGYLGTEKELAFQELETAVSAFKDGAESIWLKRMGRAETELWYEEVDFRKTHILLIEWTHGNSDYFQGVDIPILLNSTPQETLAYRKARNRDSKTDSAFTAMVLEIEQELLHRQAKKAKLILSKKGELLSYEAYSKLMEESGKKDEERDVCG